jgi:tripartite-type tricarboxylate transporter receptor subunit TctC
MRIVRPIIITCFVFAALTAALTSRAQAAWPMDKPMTIIINWPPGTGPDVFIRILVEGLQKKWGNTIVAENRAGASGNVGQAYAARAVPDGYTWLHASPGPAANNSVSFRSLPYNPLTDFTFVTQTSETDMILVSRNGLAKDFKEIIAKAKAKPESVKMGHPGNGTYAHMLGLKVGDAGDIKFNMIPYKGAPQMLVDLMSSEIDLAGDQIPVWVEQVKAGKVTAIATFGDKRSTLLPDVPTMKELGLNVTAAPWYGFLGPKGVPNDIRDQMAKAIAEVLSDPARVAKFKAANLEPKSSSPAAFEQIVKDEIGKWKPVIEKYNLYLD